MRRATRASLRAQAPWRAAEGFGGATRAASRYVEPTSSDELATRMADAARESARITGCVVVFL